MRLSDLLPTSFVSRVLLRHKSASRLLRREQHGQVCPYLPLAETRDGFRRSLGSSMRVNLRRKIQRLEEGGVRFGWLETPQDLTPALETFYALHEMRWRTRNQTGNFLDPRVRLFHQDVVANMGPLGRVRLYFLWHGERAVASLYALQYKGTLFCYQTGFDPTPPDASIRITKYSPGLVVIGRSMEDAIERSLREFDFLRGPEGYKFEWTSAVRMTQTVTLARRNAPVGALYLLGQWLESTLKAPIRRLLGRDRPVRGSTE
jgi:CelD/BcsL family acetyltransferase involved in cellulose biosynthesis